ncbi:MULTISPECIES: aspartate aminotransferase family protein [Brevibacterium]|uniref:Taurine---2-oxoglutarate transaminase n=1 Tax=Brevibacterium antiquum CNRZ 918 TaxID=1255637 RepID=A0A2H1KPQ6_9MICO|nr:MULTISPECIES: aspartate aminotransferase family protein [Brevibacterium]SMY01726.1 taurine---2-oxoglutarate transaminase [Brevibacterium antiquum CNRZ 918]HCG56095.1 aspartate aminotransferase family protein [Brevibacterium sp.]
MTVINANEELDHEVNESNSDGSKRDADLDHGERAFTADQVRVGQRAHDLDRAHVFHSWQAQGPFDPMTILAAEGPYIWDGEGQKLLDMSSQLVNTNIGHQHPKVVAAIQEQAAKLCTIAPQHVNDARSEAARLITDRAPGDLDHVFFTNGGADANEHAIRMARLHTGRTKVLSAYRSYHGGTQLAVNATGDPRRFASDYSAEGIVHFMPAYQYRSYFGATTEAEETQRALQHLEDMITLEGPSNIAALILETVPGTAGIYGPPAGYLEGVRELTTRYGIIYIADEVMAGFGRTGRWFAVDHWDVTPDLITFAKGVNSGYVPLGGVVISDAIFETFRDRVYPGGLTYSGHPLACAAAVATINAMDDEGMIGNAERLGRDIIGPALHEMAQRHPSIGDVRGMGCFWAVELVKDRTTREPLAAYGGSSPEMNRVIAAMKSGGVLPFANFNRIHVVPPLNTPDADVRFGLKVLDEALSIADEYVI